MSGVMFRVWDGIWLGEMFVFGAMGFGGRSSFPVRAGCTVCGPVCGPVFGLGALRPGRAGLYGQRWQERFVPRRAELEKS